MTINELLDALCDRDATLYVDGGGALRYLGPKLAADDPLRAAIAEHRAMLVELFTYAPGERCAEDGCYRLRVGGAETCVGPHLVLDLLPDRGSLEAA